MIHIVKGFCMVNKAEVGVFLESSCFFYHPTNVGNLISGSSVFSKSSLYIWNFTVSMCLCVCPCHCEWCICLCDCVSENVFVCVCLCPCTLVGASAGLTLRGRGLPIHVYTPVTCVDQWYPVLCSLVVQYIHHTKHHHTAFRHACVETREGGILGGQ